MSKSAANGFSSDQATEDARAGDQITVRELARFLNALGKSLQAPANGPLLGESLVRLSKALRNHQDRELDYVLGLLAGDTGSRGRQSQLKSKPLEGLDLTSIQINQLRDLIFDEELTRQELIQLGIARLGISRSLLARQSKQAILEMVMGAVQNEEVHHIISKEAEREGLRRGKVQRRV